MASTSKIQDPRPGLLGDALSLVKSNHRDMITVVTSCRIIDTTRLITQYHTCAGIAVMDTIRVLDEARAPRGQFNHSIPPPSRATRPPLQQSASWLHSPASVPRDGAADRMLGVARPSRCSRRRCLVGGTVARKWELSQLAIVSWSFSFPG